MKNNSKEKKLKSGRISVKPFVYNIPSISSVSIRFIILLAIQVIMLFITKSYSALLLVGSTLIGAIAAAFVNPPTTAFIISFATIVIGRSIMFKGINNWLNISSVAVIIAWYIGRKYFPGFSVTAENLSLRNTSIYLIENGSFPIYSFDSTITSFLNKYIFYFFKVTVPEGYVSLMWDTHSIIPAFRFNLITIISSIIIFSDNAFSLIIPSLFLIVYGLLVRLFVPFLFGGYFNQGDIILAMLTSGILFCSVFLIQWYGTIPVTTGGKVILGILSGISAFAIIGSGTSPIGMAYNVIITNIISMIIRIFEEKHNELVVGKVITKYSSKLAVEQEGKK